MKGEKLSEIYGKLFGNGAPVSQKDWCDFAKQVTAYFTTAFPSLTRCKELEARVVSKQAELDSRNATLATWHKIADERWARVTELVEEAEELRAKLKTFEPPAAKFRLNEIVVTNSEGTNGALLQVKARWYHEPGREWRYRLGANTQSPFWSVELAEKEIKKLNTDEKGES